MNTSILDVNSTCQSRFCLLRNGKCPGRVKNGEFGPKFDRYRYFSCHEKVGFEAHETSNEVFFG